MCLKSVTAELCSLDRALAFRVWRRTQRKLHLKHWEWPSILCFITLAVGILRSDFFSVLCRPFLLRSHLPCYIFLIICCIWKKLGSVDSKAYMHVHVVNRWITFLTRGPWDLVVY